MAGSANSIDLLEDVGIRRINQWTLPQEVYKEIIPVKELIEIFERGVKALTGESITKKMGQWIRKEIQLDTEVAKAQQVKIKEILKRHLAFNPLVRYTGHNGFTWKHAKGSNSVDGAKNG